MIKTLCFSIAFIASVQAEFDIDSLVLTEAPNPYQWVSGQAESKLFLTKDLEEAIGAAVAMNKPIVLIVVGKANCPWSERLLVDVIYKPEFYLEAEKNMFCAS